MKIVVDGMGGDHAPHEIVKGCLEAVKEYGIRITLTGDSTKLEQELKNLNAPLESFEIIHTSEVITMDDPPVKAIKRKTDSSMVKGLEMIRGNFSSVLISAGNTGALLAGGLLKVGRIKGIDRPALTSLLPFRKSNTLLLDMGANTECKPENLAQFAMMGSVYMESVVGKKNPTVGLLNIGTEETKGSELYKAAYQIMKGMQHINFVGNVEARDVPEGVVDILVCDGFTGNIVLKYTEGLAYSLFGMLKDVMMKNTVSKVAALILKPSLREFKNGMDYTEVGGAPLLGINGGVIKAHGSSNAAAMKNAIRQGMLYLENGVLERIQNAVTATVEDKL
ncbi:MAG TPA: phosphate acyltransferase PlsX [Clostridiales bacterium]|nr:phosphate acyltransferase PlsX [Clostridiales bacterium]